MTRSQFCPSCGDLAVPPYGPASKILIIGEFPGDDEMRTGRPFSGATGKVFLKELQKVGLDMQEFRMMNLWLHPIREAAAKGVMDLKEYKRQIADQNEKCLKAGYDLCLDEARGKKSIILVGSEAVKMFTEYSVSDVCGLEVPSVFSCKHVWAIVNPAIVFHRGVGELRLALSKWSSFLKENKLA